MKKGKTVVKHIPLNEDQEAILDKLLSNLEYNGILDPPITCYYEINCKHCGYECEDHTSRAEMLREPDETCGKCGKELTITFVPNISPYCVESVLDCGAAEFNLTSEQVILFMDNFFPDHVKTQDFIEKVKEVKMRFTIDEI